MVVYIILTLETYHSLRSQTRRQAPPMTPHHAFLPSITTHTSFSLLPLTFSTLTNIHFPLPSRPPLRTHPSSLRHRQHNQDLLARRPRPRRCPAGHQPRQQRRQHTAQQHPQPSLQPPPTSISLARRGKRHQSRAGEPAAHAR